MSTAYYNENDPFAAAWLRELIKDNLIAPGEVDERSIEDVLSTDLRGFTQGHFFAGIGAWSYALRSAGWRDDQPVWTGSCPCQPFSAAGKRTGTADERHLWPAWFHLIEQCRPAVIFGEQVTAAIKHGWLDLVQADLEGIGYTVGAQGMAACSVGAPHIRKRLYFVGSLDNYADSRYNGSGKRKCGSPLLTARPEQPGLACGTVADSASERRQPKPNQHPAEVLGLVDGTRESRFQSSPLGATLRSFWSDAEWLRCRDEQYRPVESGTFPLVTGSPNRVGRLRGYGNAITAPVAEAFVRAYIETREGR